MDVLQCAFDCDLVAEPCERKSLDIVRIQTRASCECARVYPNGFLSWIFVNKIARINNLKEREREIEEMREGDWGD